MCVPKAADNAVPLSELRTSPTGLSAATSIGRYVTIGQGCLLRSTTIENECIVGDKSILMEGSLVERQSILAPGTIVTPGRLIPSGQLWAGNPARYVRDLTKDEVSHCFMHSRNRLQCRPSQSMSLTFANLRRKQKSKQLPTAYSS